MRALLCISFCIFYVAFARGPKGPKRPPPPFPPFSPPSFPPGPVAPSAPSGPTGGGGGTCATGDADASKCGDYVPPDTSGLGPFGPDIASSEPSSSASANSNCGNSARPYYEEYVSGDFRYIMTSGVPDHAAECGQIFVNPNVRCKFISDLFLETSCS